MTVYNRKPQQIQAEKVWVDTTIEVAGITFVVKAGDSLLIRSGTVTGYVTAASLKADWDEVPAHPVPRTMGDIFGPVARW